MEFLTHKGIIPFIMGGLGNQLFIIVAAYISSKIKNCPLYILNNPLSNNKHNLNNINYNNSILKYFGIHLNIDQSDGFRFFLLGKGYFYHSQSNGNAFKSWDPQDVAVGSIMSSYYQYYPVIKPYEQEIRSLLLKGLCEHHNITHIQSPETTAFLHIRRGDYLENPHIHFIQSHEYYSKAFKKLLELNKEVKEIKVFSDDVAWVKSCEFFNTPIFTIVDEKDELKTLHIMSQCKAGAICANSTFSWWGAFLGAHGQKNPVLIPKDWISLKVEALFPEEWIIVDKEPI
jgi:hypothetical protein